MKRRHALQFALGTGVAAQVSLLWAQTPAAALRRVGVLMPSTRAKEEVILKPFFDEMRAIGWIEGQNVVYDRVYADDQQRDLPRLAAELVARNPELIYAPPQSAAVAARQATRSIAIVFATGINPVGAGLVTSLALPGGNATGVLSGIESLAPKRIELLREMLREMLPGTRRIGLLGDPNDPRVAGDRNALAPVATALGMTIIVGEASNPVEFDPAVARLIGQGVDVIYGTGTLVTNLRGRLIEQANRRRLPVIGGNLSWVEAGALFSYSGSQDEQIRRSAQIVDKILKGARPADIPVEQPTKFELVINLKAAKALGITVPQALLLRADEVIQ